VTFNPSSNYDSNFTIATSVDDGVAAAITGTKNISGTAVGDTPQVGNIITLQGTQSDLIIIDRNVNDGAEVTSFRISGITNGTLYQADGVTQINDGDYITSAQAQAGVRFTPAPGSIAVGSFDVESSEDGVSAAAQSGTDTSTITVTPAVPTENIDPEPDPTDIPGDDVDNVDDPETETEPIDNPLSGSLKGKSLIPKPSAFVPGFDQAIENSGDFGGTSSLGEVDWEYNEDYDTNALMIDEGEDVSNITSDFYSSIDSSIEMLRNSIESIGRQDGFIIKAVKGVTLTLSVGLATWVLRTGSLVASALTSIPIWKSFDPLPVLPLSRKKRREKINEVRIIEKDERMKNKKVADLLDGEEGDEVWNAKEEDES
jgi:hypothetical protein